MTQSCDTKKKPQGVGEKKARRRPGRPTLSNEELLDTALDLFLENGFERTSIDAIASTAGMAKRTIYARYEDKTNLFVAALTRAIDDWVVPVDRLRAAETEDLEATLLAIGETLVENILSPAGLRLMRLTNAESVRMPEISTYSVRRGTEPTVNYLSDLFKRRLKLEERNAVAAGQAFLNLVVGGPASNAAWGMVIDPGEIGAHVRFSVHLFLHGLMSEQGSAETTGAPQLRDLIGSVRSQLEDVLNRLDKASKLAGE